MTGIVLILGASGRFGRHAAEAFWNAGWRVRLFDRRVHDLMDKARGVNVIVNGWNPPYPDWAKQVPVLTDQVIAAARLSDATVLIPGNVYGYGSGLPVLIDIHTPKAARNALGLIRNRMETAYRDAGVKTIVLRAGDFIDTEPSGNWFDAVITAKIAKGKIISPGNPEVPHAWAYLPDLARAAAALADKRDALQTFHEVLFPGYALSIRDIAQLAEKATGRTLRPTRMNWLPIWLAAPFWKTGRHLIEMRYLWSQPHRIDAREMIALLPRFRQTDPLTAIASALGQSHVDPDHAMTRRAHHIAAE